jgi:hypothetical protein
VWLCHEYLWVESLDTSNCSLLNIRFRNQQIYIYTVIQLISLLFYLLMTQSRLMANSNHRGHQFTTVHAAAMREKPTFCTAERISSFIKLLEPTDSCSAHAHIITMLLSCHLHLMNKLEHKLICDY